MTGSSGGFPQSMSELLAGGIDRRHFLQLMAASLGLAGLAGCRRPELKALPYSKPPEEVVPGLPNFYATAMPRRGSAFPILVESHEGRPTKIEGNPRQPDSGGSSDALAQASVLELYDPDRASPVLQQGQPSTWKEYDAFAAKHYAAIRERKGKGLRILSDDPGSPSLDLLREHCPRGLARGALACLRAGIARQFAGRGRARLRLAGHPSLSVRPGGGHPLPRQRLPRPRRGWNAASSRVSPAAGWAEEDPDDEPALRGREPVHDHRRHGRSPAPAALLPGGRLHPGAGSRAALGEKVVPAPGSPQAALRQALASYKPSVKLDEKWIREVAADLRAHAGKGIIIAGRRQPPVVHALAFALNSAAGQPGQDDRAPEAPCPAGGGHARRSSSQAIDKGEVETLIILGGNPAYNAPADLGFADRIKKVATTIRLGLHADETSRLASWHLPAAHYLESWGDARAGDGTVLPIQPLIEPLFEGRNVLEELARLTKFETSSPYEIVRRTFRKISGVTEAGFEAAWRKFLHEGTSAAGPIPSSTRPCKWDAIARAVTTTRPGPASALGRRTSSWCWSAMPRSTTAGSPTTAGSRSCSNPITKLAWGNAAMLSPKTAQELGIRDGDVVRLELDGRSSGDRGHDPARPGRLLGGSGPGLRADGLRPGRPGRGLQRLPAAHVRGARHRPGR